MAYDAGAVVRLLVKYTRETVVAAASPGVTDALHRIATPNSAPTTDYVAAKTIVTRL